MFPENLEGVAGGDITGLFVFNMADKQINSWSA